MSYFIPRGTPLEIAQYGTLFCPHVTQRDLQFPGPIAETIDEFKFHDGYWVLMVPRALVIEKPAAANVTGGTEGFVFPVPDPNTEYTLTVVPVGELGLQHFDISTSYTVTQTDDGSLVVDPSGDSQTSFTFNSSSIPYDSSGTYEMVFLVLSTRQDVSPLPPGAPFWPLVTAHNHDSYDVVEGGTLTVPASEGVLSGDYDINNDPISDFKAEVVQQPPPEQGELLSFNEDDGSFVFKATANFFGETFFRYYAIVAGIKSLMVTVYMQVQPPTEKMYAIDGTSADAADGSGSNVELMCNQARQAGEPFDYFAGPKDVPFASDSPKILTAVEHQIAEDLAAAASMDQPLHINLIGWSRGM